jgi:hypothetical protein
MLYLIYPTITAYTLSVVKCSTIDGVSYLKRDFSIICYTKEHILMVVAVGLPIAIIWILGYPIIVYFILRRNKDKINDENMIIKYGTFYIGLKEKAYYWEILVINIRKVLLSIIVVGLSTQKVIYPALIVILILFVNC